MSLPLNTMLEACRQRAKRGELQPFHALPAVWASQMSVEGTVGRFSLTEQETLTVQWSIVPGSQRWDLAFADPYDARGAIAAWLDGRLNLFWLS